jgi:hypothetical protein
VISVTFNSWNNVSALQHSALQISVNKLVKKCKICIKNRSSNINVRNRSMQLQAMSAVEVGGVMQGFSEAFVGGTVGVMSVMFILELRKVQDKTDEEFCPYCMGNGEILCGTCLGSTKLANGAQCTSCQGRGLVTCINCKGDGRITPILLQSKATRDPEYAADGISVDSA